MVDVCDSAHPEPDQFSLLKYLAADLRRAHEVMSLRPPEGLRLWRGVVSPRFIPVLLCRLSYWFHLRRLGFVSKILALMNFIVFGIEITPRTSIGKGLFFPHTQGTVIGAASIGQNATIYHGVTLGAKSMDAGFTPAMRPVIGDNVLIAAGAKVLGGIEVGDSVRIWTNSVVLKSVPAGSLVRTLQAEIMPPAP